MIQTVIFDMDGVIIDSEPIHFKIEKQLFNELGITVPLEEHYSYVGTSTLSMWEKIVKKYHLQDRPEDLTKKDKDLYMKYLAETRDLQPIGGIRELIKDLHQNNFTIIVASSSY